jgi:hypothetical protein
LFLDIKEVLEKSSLLTRPFPDLNTCGMRGCNKSTVIISPIDIKWFYKISETGLSIDRKDLHKIIEDPNMPRDVKKEITKIFPHLS